MNVGVKFTVTNRATGSVFDVAPGETVLAGAWRAGVHLSYSCLNGTCAICHAQVVDGDWHYPYLPPSSLDAAQRERGEALLCQAVPRSDLTIIARETAALKDIVTRRLRVTVSRTDRLASDVLRLRLALPAGVTVDYLAGQYLDCLLPGGKRRAFSIAAAPRPGEDLELHVRQVPGGGFTDFLFREATIGTALDVELPLGTFFLRERSLRPVLCVAGGTGFAPIKAIIEQFLANGDGRPLTLYWGAKTRPELYLDALARRWAADHPQLRYVPVLSEATSGEPWSGRRGWVHEAVLADHPELRSFDLYMSGPPPLIEAGRREFLAAGLPEAHLFYDSFEFAPDVRALMLAGQRARAGGL